MADEFMDGQLKLSLENVLSLQLDKKSICSATIARFNWELGAVKMNFLDDNSPKPNLFVYVQCAERGRRLEGWGCTAKIKLVIVTAKKTKSYSFEHVHFPLERESEFKIQEPLAIKIPWDKLTFDFLGEADSLQICAKIVILEQIGYGTLMPLNVKLNVRGTTFLVNKYHLATYSSFFQAFFSGCLGPGNRDREDYELNDPDDDVEAFRMMLALANPVENYPHPADNNIAEILRLADKYDLAIVCERCEKFLISEDSGKPLVQKLVLAERYQLFNLKSHCLDRISPAHFCLELRESIAVYNELSDGLKAELEERMARKSGDELDSTSNGRYAGQHSQQEKLQLDLLPPPHKRFRPRPKTPPRPNNLPPFRFK